MNYRDYFRGKKITLMGLGLLGRGVGDAKFLAECGANLIVTDLKSAKDLSLSLKKLKAKSYLPDGKAGNLKAITYVLGEHRLEDFRNRDLIIKAAGVPLDSPYIAEAKKNKIPVVMSTALFVKFAQSLGVKIIGVTGTRGKTTVTSLIYEILCQGLPLTSKRVWLGGNVKGISTLALLPKVKSGDWVVLELDSWQLQGFASPVGLWPRGDLGISPQIAVFTNFMADHLNYYHGDMKCYFADKTNIYKYQKKNEIVFVGREVSKKIKSPSRKVVPPALPKNWKLNLVGKHNRVNASFAVAVARELGVSERIIKKVVENFAGVPGRLELIRTWRGIKIYNDTTSTTPDATIVALQTLGQNKKPARRQGGVILIMGGADKNLPLDILIKILPKYCKAIILLPGTGTNKLRRLLPSKVGVPTEASGLKAKSLMVADLREAVTIASELARTGDTILLSPGFASFGPPPGGFKNEYDRGAQFVKLIEKLE